MYDTSPAGDATRTAISAHRWVMNIAGKTLSLWAKSKYNFFIHLNSIPLWVEHSEFCILTPFYLFLRIYSNT